MVTSSVMVVTVAKMSAELWQEISCNNEEHVSSSQLLDLICCLPIEQLGRLAFCLWTFFCLPPSPDHNSYYYYYNNNNNSNNSSDDDDDDDEFSENLSSFYVDDRGYSSHSD